MHPSNNVARVGIDDIDVVGRPTFPRWNVEQLSIWIDRQPIDAGSNCSIPEHRVVVNVEAIDHARACNVAVGNVKLPGDSANSHSSDIADAWNRLNSFDQPMPGINVVDRNRSPI